MKEKTKDWYEIENVDQIDSPAFIIYQERLKIWTLVCIVRDSALMSCPVNLYKVINRFPGI